MPKKKEKIESSITRTLVINGEEKEFKLSITYKKDDKGNYIRDRFGKVQVDKYYFRPTQIQLFENPRLRTIRQKSLGKVLTTIKELYEVDDPEKVQKHFFNDELDKYIIDVKKNGSRPVRDTTFAGIQIVIKNQVKPYFEGLLVKDVDDVPCRKMINSLLTKGYSKSVINKAHLYVNEFLEYLYLKDIIKKNWMKLVSKPTDEQIKEVREQLNKKTKEKRYLSTEEINKFRQAAYGGREAIQTYKKSGKTVIQHHEFYQPEVYDLLLITGLRTGELLALTYNDWNPNDMTLDIKKGRVTYIDRSGLNNKLITKETAPKNTASRSIIYLSEEANELLKTMLNKEPKCYTGHIVHNKKHQPISVRTFEGRFERVVKAAGLDGVTPHDFRHTYASILNEESNGNIVFVSKKLRHKDVTTTANIYIDWRDREEKAIDKKVKILGNL